MSNHSGRDRVANRSLSASVVVAWPAMADACRCGEPAVRVGVRRYRFTIERIFRGSLSGAVDLFSGNDGGSCFGYSFAKGQRYLVYASNKHAMLTTGYCSGNRPINQAAEQIAYLNRP